MKVLRAMALGCPVITTPGPAASVGGGASSLFVAATSDVLMRLNLWFASRVQPDVLASQRARLSPAIRAADAAYAFVLCVLGAAGAGSHDELAAVLVGGAIVSLLSLLLIEPATSRAAFERARGRRRPTPRRTPRTPSR